jgi:hypothetical protein
MQARSHDLETGGSREACHVYCVVCGPCAAVEKPNNGTATITTSGQTASFDGQKASVNQQTGVDFGGDIKMALTRSQSGPPLGLSINTGAANSL